MHRLAIANLAYKYPPHPLLRLMDSSSNIGMLSYAPADRRWKPAVEVAPAPPNCPRCDSSNTKFCYYNNYSLSQPRYFCKGCRRYWTKGGSLRNVPVGGRCRKSRRGKSGRLSAPLAAARRSPPHAARRPDLMLNDAYTTAADDTETHRPAAAIDLEVLYAKYLNQADPPGPPASTPEIAAATTSSESSCGQIPLQFPTQQLPLECQSAVAHPPSMEETLAMSQINDMLYNFSVDSSSSLAPLPPPAIEPEDKQASSLFDCPKDSISINYEEFESFPALTTCMQQHQQGSMLEDEWSSLDYSTLEAFYRC